MFHSKAKNCFLLGIALFCLELTAADVVLESTPITNWGYWGEFQNCSLPGTYVQAFQLKTEPWQGDDDDTALNAIRFFCGYPSTSNQFTENVTSTIAAWGYWGSVFQCGFGQGLMIGFQLNVESYVGDRDDTATNNLRIICSNHQNETQFVQGDGSDFGTWRDHQKCPDYHAICGIQTQVEPYQGNDDDTALNNIRVKCCPILS